MIQKKSTYDPKAKTKRSLEYTDGSSEQHSQKHLNILIIISHQQTARAGTSRQSSITLWVKKFTI